MVYNMASFIAVLGGIGFFLLGMSLMADGLKAIAGDALKKLLSRFTGGTIPAILTGTVITLLVQSSTATTLMTIGFVSAGMLTFIQAAGVIFGANLGTTSTGWLVAIIGLKFSISNLALPIIGIGVLLKQFSKGRLAQTGLVLAGFGLLFIGIQFLQDGMADLNAYIDLSALAGSSLWHLLALVGIGILMTIIMQSSSAAVATTITVLAAGTIDLEQAIALVIGQNIGTTATAIIAAIGASVSAKRTAAAHTLFNVSTGVVMLLIFPWAISALGWAADAMGWSDPAMTLALFHTGFSLLGILVFAPFIKQFTALIERLLPEKQSTITQHLDQQLIALPAFAIETAHRALKEAASLTLEATMGKFTALAENGSAKGKAEAYDEQLLEIHQEMTKVRTFISHIRTDSAQTSAGYIANLHALDHLTRLNKLVRTGMNDLRMRDSAKKLYPAFSQLQAHLAACRTALQAEDEDGLAAIAELAAGYSRDLANFRKQERANAFHEIAADELQIDEAMRDVQLMLFIDGVAYHQWRLLFHLSGQSAEEELA